MAPKRQSRATSEKCAQKVQIGPDHFHDTSVLKFARMSNSEQSTLVGVIRCREILFPDPKSAPGIRTFNQWMANRYFPVHKIGRRVFLDPVEVRSAFDRRFKINAVVAN